MIWNPDNQAEITAYVEELREDRKQLITLRTLTRGIPEVQKLLDHLGTTSGWVQDVDWGDAAGTLEKRAEVLLRTLTSPDNKPLDTTGL